MTLYYATDSDGNPISGNRHLFATTARLEAEAAGYNDYKIKQEER